jgi:hypothetical protein
MLVKQEAKLLLITMRAALTNHAGNDAARLLE